MLKYILLWQDEVNVVAIGNLRDYSLIAVWPFPLVLFFFAKKERGVSEGDNMIKLNIY